MDLTDPLWFLWGSESTTTTTKANQPQTQAVVTKKPHIVKMDELHRKKRHLNKSKKLELTNNEAMASMKTLVHDIMSPQKAHVQGNNTDDDDDEEANTDITYLDDEPAEELAVAPAAAPQIQESPEAKVSVGTIQCEKNEYSLNNGEHTATKNVCHMNAVIMQMDRNMMHEMKREKSMATKRYRLLKVSRRLLHAVKRTLCIMIGSMGIMCFALTYLAPFVGISALTFKLMFSSVLWTAINAVACLFA